MLRAGRSSRAVSLPEVNRDELLKLRNWRHDVVDPELQAFKWQIGALDKWREVVDRDLGKLQGDFVSMQSKEAIASAVAEQLRRDRAFGLSLLQKLGLGLVALASPAVSAYLVHLLGG